MIWRICYGIAVSAVLLAILLFIRRRFGKKMTFTSAAKPMFFGAFIALFSMLLPIQLDAFGSGFGAVIKAVLAALNRTLRGFVLTDVNFMNPSLSIDPGFYELYSASMTVLCFLCPFLSLSYVLSFFSKFKNSLRLAVSGGKDLYVFSQLNSYSLALAKDIASHHRSVRVIFCGVNDETKKRSNALLQEAERICAACFTKEILALHISPARRRGSLMFFTMGEDEQKNTDDAVGLIARFRERANTAVYLFSSLAESTLVMSGMDCGKVKAHCIYPQRSSIYRFLYDEGEVIFRHAHPAADGGKDISVVLLGLGKCGAEMLKALSWYCQMEGYHLRIDAFDCRKDARDLLEAACPDLFSESYNGVRIDGDAEYTIAVHSGCDHRMADFERLLSRVEHPTFAFVALGDDRLNIEASTRLRTLFERRGADPDIYTLIRSVEKQQMLTHLTNFKGQPYRICAFGDIASAFSEKEIIGSEIEQEALRLHLQWGDEDSFYRYEYNYQSSAARAIHSKACRSLSADGGAGERDPQRAALTEHRRWNAYMRSIGYVYSGSTARSSRNDLAMVHNDLVPFHHLSREEQLKDHDRRS